MFRTIYDATALATLNVACWGLDQIHDSVRALERVTSRPEPRKTAVEKRTRTRQALEKELAELQQRIAELEEAEIAAVVPPRDE